MLTTVIATFFRLTTLEQIIVLVGFFILMILAGFYPIQSGAATAALIAIIKVLQGK
jgi:hypothetical protein